MDSKKQKSAFVQVVLGLITNFSSLSPSMSLGFSAIALPYLQSNDNPYKLEESAASWVASIASIATPIGCFVSGPICDRFGRKVAILCINIVCVLGWIVIALAYHLHDNQYALLLLGRILTGLSTGLSSMPAVVYMAEVSSPKLRGMFITWNALSFAVGVLIIYAFGWILKDDWGTVATISGVFPCVGMLMAWIYMFESPTWLISKNRVNEAEASMCKLFNTKEYDLEVYEEIETLISHKSVNGATKDSTESPSSFRYALQPIFYKPFILMVLYFFFQQFSGVFVVVFYAVDIVKQCEITIDPYLAICLIAAMRVIASIIVSFLSKRIGRRPLSIVSGAGMTLCMALLGVYLIIVQKGDMANTPDWIPLTLLMAYFFVSTLGFLTMPFAMNAEVFPAKVRGFATGLVTCIAYIFNFIIVKMYPDMISKMGNYQLFFCYGAVSLVGTVFIAFFLPETNGKTLSEIEEYFGKRKDDAHVHVENSHVPL